MKNEQRNITMKFYVSPQEKELIRKRMELAGVINQSAFLRKQAIDGYIIRLETPELIDFVSISRRYCNLLNQITRRVNATGHLYESDLEEIRAMSKSIQNNTQNIFAKFLELK